ncbi:MAG TPA: phosphatidylglycerophosphatase A [Thermoanaerobaculia bacterium]|jgi:phosphatidylglycerophosphatase A
MPDARRAFAAHPLATLLATGFGAGLSPLVPGTAGSALALAAAWLSYASIFPAHAGSVTLSVGLLMSGLVVGLLGVAAAGPVCRALESKDPGCIVIDEISGQLIASAAVPLMAPYRSGLVEAGAWIVSFLLFRFFDVVKPGPIRRLQELPGGWGVVADDVAGGLAAAAALFGLGWVAVRLGWI